MNRSASPLNDIFILSIRDNSLTQTYFVFMRGINVGGPHKVPMVERSGIHQNMGIEEVKTVLNFGNIIFKAEGLTIDDLEQKIAGQLETASGFPVSALICPVKDIRA